MFVAKRVSGRNEYGTTYDRSSKPQLNFGDARIVAGELNRLDDAPSGSCCDVFENDVKIARVYLDGGIDWVSAGNEGRTR